MVITMKRNLALVILLGLLCIALPASAAGNIWYVAPPGGEIETDFTTIQGAVDAASSGDTVVVFSGTYSCFRVSKPYLTFQIIENDGPVIIDGSTGPLRIPSSSSDNATGTILDGFTFSGGTPFQLGTYGPAPDSIIRNCTFNGLGSAGIIISIENCTFENNTIDGGSVGYAVTVTRPNLVFRGNTIKNAVCTNGALVLNGGGNATIENNSIINCTGTRNIGGFLIRNSAGCVISNNILRDWSGNGIYFFETSANNTVTGNDLGNTTVYFRNAGENNRIYLNNNVAGVGLYAGTTAPATTSWNATAPVTYTYNGVEYTGYPGNFWSEIPGEDADGDGIGDTPYVVPNGLGTDYAPLMGAWEDGVIVSPPPEPKTWYVDDSGDADFTSIQDAVNNATSGDTIIVLPGNYSWFGVTKPYLTIQAFTNDGSVIVDCKNSAGLELPSGSNQNATGTILDGLTIVNPGAGLLLGQYGPAPNAIIRNCTFNGISASAGMVLKSPNCVFEDNIIDEASANNILAVQSGSVLRNNIIKNSRGSNCVIYVQNGEDVVCENNTFVNCTGTLTYGVLLVRNSTNCAIANNTLIDIDGIGLYYYQNSADNTVIGNDFGTTTIYFRDAGNNNRIYLNNNLAGVALHAGTTAPATTSWNATSPVTYTYNGVEYTGYPGNFWAELAGEDADGDGIGDTPYVLPDGLGTDYAPLMGAWEGGVITGSEPALPYTVLYNGTVDIPAGSTIMAAISPISGGYKPGEDFVEIPANSVGGMLDASDFIFDMWKSQKPVPTYSLQNITTPDGVLYPNVQNATANLAWRSFDGMTAAAKKYDPNVALENGTTIYTVYGDYNVVNSDPSGAQYVIVTTLNVVEPEPEPATWYVDDDGGADFTTIQAAVDAASAGDTIVVKDGAYTENVNVTGALVLMTENGRENVVVTAASPAAPVFAISADGVTVRDFTVRGPTNEHIAGIENIGYDDCLIIGNDCGGALYNGIHLGGDATNNTVTENYCHDNTRRGISLRDSVHGNYVYNNLCIENGEAQICIKDNANGNFVWANTFVGAVECLSPNTFNSTEPVAYTYKGAEYTGFAGNFWSDYTGVDVDGNGIGDAPYTLPGGTDYAPLMGAWEDGVIVGSRPEPIVFNTAVTVYADEPIVVDGTTYGGNTFFNILAAAGYTYTYAESDAGYGDRKPLLTLTIDGVTYPTEDFGPDYAWKFYETLGTGNDVKFKKALNGYISKSGTYYIWYGDMSQFDWWELPSIENSTYVVALTVELLPTRPGEDGAPTGVTIISPLPNSGYAVGASVRLAATATGDNLTYTWDLGNGDTVVGQDTSYAYPAAGNYTITLTVANDAGSAEASTGITILDSDQPYIVLYQGTVDIADGSTILAAISPRSGGYVPGEDFVEIPAESVGGMLNASGFIFDLWKSTKPIPTYSLTDITTPDGVYYPNVQDATANLAWRSFDGMTSAATKYDPDVPLANGTTIYTVYGDYDVVNSDPSGAQYVIITTLNIVVTEPEEEADTIVLRPGWNFVSTPKRLADGANTFAIFDGVDTAGRSILLYDGLDYDWRQMGLTDTFRPLDAVWIYANGTYEIPLTFAGGTAELPPKKALGKGWNAIGFSDTVPESAAATLLSLEDSWATLIGYDAVDQRYERSIIRTTAGETQKMQPMQGYWIYTTRAETLAAISG